jgi:hypothetical protein
LPSATYFLVLAQESRQRNPRAFSAPELGIAMEVGNTKLCFTHKWGPSAKLDVDLLFLGLATVGLVKARGVILSDILDVI